MKTQWPNTVPILTADDFCRGMSRCGSQLCLASWLTKTFPNVHARGEATAALFEEIKRFTNPVSVTLIRFNDNPRNSRQLLADVWNGAMKRLGYLGVPR